jgi:hypothetical protein
VVPDVQVRPGYRLVVGLYNPATGARHVDTLSGQDMLVILVFQEGIGEQTP